MKDFDENKIDDNLTQKDIIKLMLHNAQHMVTRDELKSDIKELKESFRLDIIKLDEKISKVENDLRQEISKLDEKISKVESGLRQEITKLDEKISKVDSKFNKIQWLIVATILSIFLKDYIFSFLK